LTDGRRFGELSVKSVTPGAVERLYEKLKVDSSGETRHRAALLSISVCKLAWSAAHRAHPTIVASANPFVGLEIEYAPKKNRAATQQELQSFVAAADADGSSSSSVKKLI
jgi:hypothetical protein